MKKFFIVLILIFSFNSFTFAKNACLMNAELEPAMQKLDEMAYYFKDIKCKSNDNICWWFFFHLAIGEPSSDLMTKFAQKVPLRFSEELNYGSFQGEAHIAQYPAYWLLKDIKLNTLLSSGQTFQNYLDTTPWAQVYTDTIQKTNTFNVNEELSWYWIANNLYSKLPSLSEEIPFESACGGGHHLTGLYFAQNPVFKKELLEFTNKINTMVLSPEIPPAYKDYPYYNLYKFYILSHAFEGFYLVKQEKFITPQLINNAIEHINGLYQHFLMIKLQVNTPEEFIDLIKTDGNSHYYYGDTLGHFRYGLNLCSQRDFIK